MSFRKEKKFRVNWYSWNNLSRDLFANGMKTLHDQRVISSLYFDNSNKQMLFDSEEGLLPRKKVRVRWYNKEKKITKETKTSSLEGRYKTSYVLDKSYEKDEMSNISFVDHQYGIIKPVLLVSYTRSYFVLKNVRFTFDQKISYLKPKNQSRTIFYDPDCVVEIKTPEYYGDDYIADILGNPTERFSKYCRGILFHKRF
ncbi:VTC domain-containing protein [Pseudomonadota bacterium]|nr:VTC domain-containing protein [Pseudomonadota bacterium]